MAGTASASARRASELRSAGCTLAAVLTGRARPFGPDGQPSGIFKAQRDEAVYVGHLGIRGDEQGDRRFHGGPEKAVHHYAFEHYAAWKSELRATSADFDRPGTFGENFSTLGLAEADVCVGDVFRAGGAVLQVSQARQPCWRLDVRTGVRGMAARVQRTGRTGWYYRVLAPGWVRHGDPLLLLERPNADWPLQRLLHHLYVDMLNEDALAEIRALRTLSPSWRKVAETRIARKAVEDWSRRLEVPGALS